MRTYSQPQQPRAKIRPLIFEYHHFRNKTYIHNKTILNIQFNILKPRPIIIIAALSGLNSR